MTGQERVIARAKAEIGYLEKASNSQLDDKTANAGKGNWTKYARDLDALGNIYNGKKNGYDWCDVFVDWCFISEFGEELGMKLLCQAYNGLGAGTKYSANYYKQKGQYYDYPEPGDQIFFGDGQSMWHTGLVVDVDDTFVYTVEGNTSTASGVIANGGGVAGKRYYKDYQYIDGYGRPDWSLVEEEEEMTQEKFNEMMDAYLAERSLEQPAGWSQESRDWGTQNGYFKGAGDLDGDGNTDFAWKSWITREEVNEVLYRILANG